MINLPNLDQVYETIMPHRVYFLFVFFVTVLLSYGFLYLIDFVPETPVHEEEIVDISGNNEASLPEDEDDVSVSEIVGVKKDPLPVELVFETLSNRRVKVLNPDSSDIAVLDEALLSGAVRHPESADLSERGNILIMGHSSHLPNILNRNFQAFNGIEKLEWGDRIRLVSLDTEYYYRVDRVYEALASEVVVPNTPGEAKLTLVTCDSFGSVDDRFIVEASLISSFSLQ